MLLIPFPFLTAAVMLMLLLAIRSNRRPLAAGDARHRRALHFIDGFFLLAAIQAVLLGIRYGYDVQALARVLPVTAVMLPPLLLLSFERPLMRQELKPHLLWHLLPVVLVLLSLWLYPPLLDFLIPAVFIIYAGLLFRLSVAPEESIPWARLDSITRSRFAIRTMVLALLVSALADIFIAIDFARSGGRYVATIGMVMQATIVVLMAILLWRCLAADVDDGADDAQDVNRDTPQKAGPESSRLYQPAANLPVQSTVRSTEIAVAGAADGSADDFRIVERCLEEQSLHLDPNLSLQRLALKSGLPPKRLSAAVNSVEGINVSQWINGKRITHAQHLLSNPDLRVSDIIYHSGFNTKSSFNREFKRITGTTPTAWRSQQISS